MEAKAADFIVEYRSTIGGSWNQIPSEEVTGYLWGIYPDCYGIGWYRGWTHLDVRSGSKVRWNKR
jgi:hypothetical protein